MKYLCPFTNKGLRRKAGMWLVRGGKAAPWTGAGPGCAAATAAALPAKPGVSVRLGDGSVLSLGLSVHPTCIAWEQRCWDGRHRGSPPALKPVFKLVCPVPQRTAGRTQDGGIGAVRGGRPCSSSCRLGVLHPTPSRGIAMP